MYWWLYRSPANKPMPASAAFWDFHFRYLDGLHRLTRTQARNAQREQASRRRQQPTGA